MSAAPPREIEIVDSHTAGEPTRVVVSGGPDLGEGALQHRLARLRDEHDDLRRGVIEEPRGSDILVGALLGPSADSTCAASVIFFNNAGYLNMCGHGAIGVAVTLAHLGRIGPGRHRLETPVGQVGFDYGGGSRVTIENVPCHRLLHSVTVDVPDYGFVTGDVAWGGNWFFLVGDHREQLLRSHVHRLTDVAWRIRRALEQGGITGAEGAPIDHIELFGPPQDPANDSRNFVLCPGGAYDRSPCGTGTSAKLACLLDDGELRPGQTWRQESILGTVFEATAEIRDGRIVPRITGDAYITGHGRLLFDPGDPFRQGVSETAR
ncbi:MAG: proline racemase family protein [Pirellulaceae bacterium]